MKAFTIALASLALFLQSALAADPDTATLYKYAKESHTDLEAEVVSPENLTRLLYLVAAIGTDKLDARKYDTITPAYTLSLVVNGQRANLVFSPVLDRAGTTTDLPKETFSLLNDIFTQESTRAGARGEEVTQNE